MSRTVVWFSCGAASAAAAKITLENTDSEVAVVYCDTMQAEHPDNDRFFNDVEEWLNHKITVIRSEKYQTVDEVFFDRRYMAGIAGAPCTVEMKKVPRFEFQRADDVHVFGYTAEEQKRAERFTENNPELRLAWPLIESGITKDLAKQMLIEAGIKLPAMYDLGFANNNCLGCVKATSARYWNNVRQNFPEVFKKRAAQSNLLGVKLVRVNSVRVPLSELPEDLDDGINESISCGPECAPSIQLGFMPDTRPKFGDKL